MYGLVFEIVEEYVIEKQGLDKWHGIKEKAGCKVNDHSFLRRSYYEDQELVDIILAASSLLGVSVEAILEDFGHYVIRHHYRNGYNDMLRCQGSTLRKWLSNLNAMHDHIAKSFEGDQFEAPIFWCEDCSTGDGSILLHYFSLRGTLLVPMVVGIVEELALFQFEVEIKMIELALQGKDGAEFTTWRLTATDPTKMHKVDDAEDGTLADDDEVDFSKMELPDTCPFTGRPLRRPECDESCDIDESVNRRKRSSGLSLSKMQTVFPFHVLVDRDFIVLQVGAMLPELLPKHEMAGKHIGEILQITRPVLGSAWDWKSLKKLSDQEFFLTEKASCNLSLKKRVSMAESHVKFKGSMIEVSDEEVMFALSPNATNVVELRRMNLNLTDLPLHSSQRDAIFLGEYIVQEVDKAHALDKLSKQLQNEKNLSNALLYNMLPKQIANELRSGKSVKPQSHENVTLFFSDIVGFTDICGQVDPWAVIDLLNKLYSVMDYLASYFNLYKVETIGDAYMCCSGLPEPDEFHAENIANFAIAVSECVKLIRSPVDGSPITLRIGIHTGSCTAGVVGTLTPHYCLFGDMVNTTARHEQTGAADKIQCSSVLYGRLKHFSRHDQEQYRFSSRGLVDMKGKGECYTYWLEGGTEYNQQVNSSKMTTLREEVADILSKKSWKMRRYFRRSGALRETDSLSSGGTGITSNSSTTISGGTDEDDADPDDVDDVGTEFHEDEYEDDDDSHSQQVVDEDSFFSEQDSLAHEEHDAISKTLQSKFCDISLDFGGSRKDLVGSSHEMLSHLLKLCLTDETTGSLPENIDMLDGQLYGIVDRISKLYRAEYCFHSFLHAANVAQWSNYLFERLQENATVKLVDRSPWYRFAIVFTALARDCKHLGVTDEQLAAEQHMLSTMYTGSYQSRYSIECTLAIFSDDFPELYEEIVWGFPRFQHVVRTTAQVSMDKSTSQNVSRLVRQLSMDESHDSSSRFVSKRTETAMKLVLLTASYGHYAQGYKTFLAWMKTEFDESMSVCGIRKDHHYFDDRVEFFQLHVLPLIDACENLIQCPNQDCIIRDNAMENLRQFSSPSFRSWLEKERSVTNSCCPFSKVQCSKGKKSFLVHSAPMIDSQRENYYFL